MTPRWRPLVGFPLVLAVLVAVGLLGGENQETLSYVTLLGTLFFYVAQATSWNVLSGYSGYFSFGQGAFVGVGVYATAVLTAKHGWNFFVTLPVAAVLSTLLALAIGAVAFRLGSFRGATFALLTLAVPFILLAAARLTRAIDGGQGVNVPVPELPAGLRFQQFFYLVMLAVAGVAVVAAYAIQHSRFGWALAAIRDNEDVAEQMGVATFRWKMLAIATTGFIGGLGGGVWALPFGYVTVESVFTLDLPLLVIVMSVLGGRGHWLGPVTGAVVIVLMQDRLADGGLEQWRLIIFGGLLAVMVVFAPDGLWSRLRARPWVSLLAGTVALGVLEVAALVGRVVAVDLGWVSERLGRVALAMLVVAVVAFWPTVLVPRRLAGRSLWTPGHPSPPPSADLGVVAPDNEGESPRTGHHNSKIGAKGGASPAGEVVIECRDVVRHFGGVRALDGLDLRIRSGELVGLVGPNGSGKTTLVNLLSGAIRPSRGSIHIGGRDTARLAPHTFTHVGVTRTYQIPRPFESMTLRDNVAMARMFGRQRHGLAEARRLATGHLEFVGLGHLAGVRPDDINLHQRQLLEMARALATSPTVLLLDEALAGLNPAEIDNAVQVVRRIHASGVTIVLVEHLLRVVNQLATRLVVLDRGRLLSEGDPDAVMNDPAVVTAYLGSAGAVPASDREATDA